MKNILRLISVLLVLLCLCTAFTGCKKDDTSSSVDTSSTSSNSGNVATGGAKPKLETAFSEFENGKPTISWSNIEGRNGWSAEFTLTDKDGNVIEQAQNLTANTYVLNNDLTVGNTYNLKAYYTTPSGKRSLFYGIDEDGMKFTYIGQGTNNGEYYFDGGISLDVLNNYLDRAMTHMFMAEHQVYYDNGSYLAGLRVIKSMNAKYIQRAVTAWTQGAWEYARFPNYKKAIDEMHKTDPDVIFEACIFECVSASGINTYPVSEATFKAFGLTPEKRNYNIDLMYFEDGYGKNQWGEGTYIPDITRLETQMFFYQRACEYIDCGFEALHLGQANLIGKKDTDNESWTKVIKMIREYASKNARRHYVILNAHYPTQSFMGSDGVMLTDFNAFPLRIDAAKDETDHAVSEDNPQRCDIFPGTGDAVYNLGIRGQHPSGWYTNEYPYLVEFDNWSGDANGSEPNIKKKDRFGYDEIAWYAAQPAWYRQQFYKDIYNRVADYDENGHVSAPACRGTPGVGEKNYYYIDEKQYMSYGYGDEDEIRAVWDSKK